MEKEARGEVGGCENNVIILCGGRKDGFERD